MKLLPRMLIGVSLMLVVAVGFWLYSFYTITIDRMYNTLDASLSTQAERLIDRINETNIVPDTDSTLLTDNSYFIERVNQQYALTHNQKRFYNETLFIDDINDAEPMRVLSTVFQHENVFYELKVLTPSFERNGLLVNVAKSAVSMLLLLIVAIVIVISLVIFRNMKPMYTMLNWLNHYKIGDPIPENADDIKVYEFKQIKESVLEATRRSQEIYEQQKQFIGNASHEIQTPLAICSNRLEMLVDNTELNEKQYEEIGKVLETLDHISKLNKSMLLIMKIENRQFTDDELLTMNPLIASLLENISEVYEYKNINISMEQKGNLAVMMNKTLANSLITNLLKNAFVHNVEGGTIKIVVDSNSLSISNTGLPNALDSEKIFSRYYHGGNHEVSSGLGLTIVNAIAKQYDIQINYSFSEGLHNFKLCFQDN